MRYLSLTLRAALREPIIWIGCILFTCLLFIPIYNHYNVYGPESIRSNAEMSLPYLQRFIDSPVFSELDAERQSYLQKLYELKQRVAATKDLKTFYKIAYDLICLEEADPSLNQQAINMVLSVKGEKYFLQWGVEK